MKTLVLYVLLATLGAAFGQSKMEMNAEARADFEKADRQLNVVYGKVQKRLDVEGRGKLRIAQRTWIAFRDAEAELHADTEARGGSMAPLILFGTMTRLTEARTKQLEEFLQPGEDH